MLFPLESFQYGFFRRSANVMLLAWDIPNMAYLSIINANDYRKNYNDRGNGWNRGLTFIEDMRTNILEVSI